MYEFIMSEPRVAILQQIFDLATPQIVFGRVALLGDAAFADRRKTGMVSDGCGGEWLLDKPFFTTARRRRRSHNSWMLKNEEGEGSSLY